MQKLSITNQTLPYPSPSFLKTILIPQLQLHVVLVVNPIIIIAKWWTSSSIKQVREIDMIGIKVVDRSMRSSTLSRDEETLIQAHVVVMWVCCVRVGMNNKPTLSDISEKLTTTIVISLMIITIQGGCRRVIDNILGVLKRFNIIGIILLEKLLHE